MSMNELPFEILLKIVTYVPNHQALALVNHRFYDAVCILDTPLMCLGVFPYFTDEHKNEEFLRSILKTTRKIRNLMVSFNSAKRPVVIEAIKKFAENIDYLRVCGRKASDLIEAISLVPSANHLELIYQGNDTHPSKRARYELHDNEELNMPRLRKLNIEQCEHEFLVMFNGLPADVLTELTLHESSLCQLAKLFKKQTKIKKLTVVNDPYYSYEEPIFDADFFDSLELEFLEWNADSFKEHNILDILPKQRELKILKLIGRKIGVDVMNIITNQLSKLDTLSIPVSEIPFTALKNITKLKNLTDLTLQSTNEENIAQFAQFATLDNSNITKLSIQHYYDISNDLLNVLAKSLPNLKMVSFHCGHNTDTFHAIFKNFNYVEVLHLDTLNIEFATPTGNISKLLKSGCENAKLNELKILYPLSYTTKFIEKMVKDYPHLKKLVIQPINRDTEKQYTGILSGFKEMESLAILRQPYMERRLYDLDLIVEYGKKLKFVALLDIDCSIVHIQIDENIKKKFGVIEYSQMDGLKMAIDRRTMKIEAECY